MANKSNYEENYSNLPFEDILRKYRFKKLCEHLNLYPHQNILDIGCGNYPVYSFFTDFKSVTVVEPGEVFFRNAVNLSLKSSKIVVLNDVVENVTKRLKGEVFDFIIIGGFLHEIPNPSEVLNALKEISSESSILFTYLPNASSFHRLLAFEMGIIDSIYQQSEHDNLFKRQSHFDLISFEKFLSGNGFKTINKGSYFIKPFTSDQMAKLIDQNNFDSAIFDGLDRMVKYMPELGSEMFVNFKLK